MSAFHIRLGMTLAVAVALVCGCPVQTDDPQETEKKAAQSSAPIVQSGSSPAALDTRRETKAPAAESSINSDVLASCVQIAVAVRDCGMNPELIEDEQTGCRILAAAPTSTIVGRVDPSTVIRTQLSENGWAEDLGYAADGPGTSAFTFRKNGILCLFSLGAPSYLEEGKIISAEQYELDVKCSPESLDGGLAAES